MWVPMTEMMKNIKKETKVMMMKIMMRKDVREEEELLRR